MLTVGFDWGMKKPRVISSGRGLVRRLTSCQGANLTGCELGDCEVILGSGGSEATNECCGGGIVTGVVGGDCGGDDLGVLGCHRS